VSPFFFIAFHRCFHSFHNPRLQLSALCVIQFWSSCISFIYLTFHGIPCLSSLVRQHYCVLIHNVIIITILHPSSVHSIPHALFLSFQRTSMSHANSMFISLLILLYGDIQCNPEPVFISLLSICALLTSGLSLIIFTMLLLLHWH